MIHEALAASSALRNRVNRLYNAVHKEIQNKYEEGFRVFLDNPNIDVSDPANLPEIEIAQARYKHTFYPSDKQSFVKKNAYTGIEVSRTTFNHLDEFMTHILTNENFSNFALTVALSNTQYTNNSWKGLKGKNVQEVILQIFDTKVTLIEVSF